MNTDMEFGLVLNTRIIAKLILNVFVQQKNEYKYLSENEAK